MSMVLLQTPRVRGMAAWHRTSLQPTALHRLVHCQSGQRSYTREHYDARKKGAGCTRTLGEWCVACGRSGVWNAAHWHSLSSCTINSRTHRPPPSTNMLLGTPSGNDVALCARVGASGVDSELCRPVNARIDTLTSSSYPCIFECTCSHRPV